MAAAQKTSKRSGYALILTVVIALLTLGGFVQAQTNLITNGGFEDGTNGWSVWGASMTITADAHTGTKAGLISNRKNSWDAAVRDLTPFLESGKTYQVSVWAKVANTSANFWATLGLNVDGTSTYQGFLSAASPINGSYVLYSGEITPVWSGNLVSANLYFETNSPGGVFPNYQIDDLVILTDDPDSGVYPIEPGLKDIKSTMLVGVCVTDGSKTYFNNEKAKAQVLSNFKTVNIQCYPAWGRWDESTKHVYHLDAFNSQVKEMKQQNMEVTAHMMLGWDLYFPEWFRNNDFEPDTLDAIMKSWLTALIQPNGNDTLVDIWNLVNEAISWNGAGGYWPVNHTDKKSACEWQRMGFEPDASGLTGAQFVNAQHPVYIRKAFEFARTLTNKKLELRDATFEFPTDQKYHAFYQLVMHLKNMGTPLDVIGFQMHIDVDRIYDWDGFTNNIKRFRKLGYEVNVGEADVGDVAKSWNDEKAELQKMQYYRLVTAAIKGGVRDFQTWGFIDNNNSGWRYGESPFPYTRNIEKKPAYFGIREALVDMSHILFWEMDASVNDTMPDVMTYNNAGKMVGLSSPVFVAGFKNKALSFDGVDDHITTNLLSDSLSGDFVFSCFVKTTSARAGVIADIAGPAGSGLKLGITDTGHLIFSGAEAGIGRDLMSATALNDDAWHFIALTRESNTYKLYLDMAMPVDSGIGVVDTHKRLVVGAAFSGESPFEGLVDEVKLYDTAIEAASFIRNMVPFRPLKPSLGRTNMLMRLSWLDQNNNETGYIIERKGPGDADFQEVARVVNKLNYSETVTEYESTYTYRVRAYNQFGASEPSVSLSATTPDNPNTAVPELDDDSGIQIYPNPSDGTLNLITRPDSSFEIFDFQGRRVMASQKLSSHKILDISSLASGVYSIHVYSMDGTAIKKLIKK